MHTRSVCEEFMSRSETEEIVEKLFRSLLQRYQDNLKEKTRGSDCNWIRTHNHLVHKRTAWPAWLNG